MKKDIFAGLFDDLKAELLDKAAQVGEELGEQMAREGLKTAIKLGDQLFNTQKGGPRALPKRKSIRRSNSR